MDKTAFIKFNELFIKEKGTVRKKNLTNALKKLSLDEIENLEVEVLEITEGIENEEPQYALYNKDFFEDLRKEIPIVRKDMQ